MKIGFIGLGQMGWPMFCNLSRSNIANELVGFDKQLDKFLPNEIRHSDTIKLAKKLDELSQSDVLITMLPNGKIVQEVLFGTSQLASKLKENSFVIDMSSSSPVDTKVVQEKLSQINIALIDAPVSGSVPKAMDGSLSIMYGNDRPELERKFLPIFAAMGKKFIPTGPTGSAHTMKCLNNYLYAAGLLAASEALLIAEAHGLDLERLVDVFNASSGRNVATETKIKQHMLNGKNNRGGFNIDLMEKDLAIAQELKEQIGIDAKQLELCYKTWNEAKSLLPHNSDNLEIIAYLKEKQSPLD